MSVQNITLPENEKEKLFGRVGVVKPIVGIVFSNDGAVEVGGLRVNVV